MGVFSGMAAFARRVQSDLVLRTARGFYLIVACISLGLILLGVIVAVIAHATTYRFTLDQPVPEVRPPQAEAIALEDVAARLSAPHNLRFVQDPPVIDFVISAGQPLGYFEADTPNGLPSYPNDFELVGGEHAGFFSFDRHPGNRRSGLRATAALAEHINGHRANLTTTAAQQLNIQVVARDSAGQRTQPTDITVSLLIGPPGSAPPEPAPTQAPADAPTPLQALAREVALAIDPNQTDVYFDVLRRALQTPRRCGARDSDEFVTQYRRGFEHVRGALNANNVDLFFRGVCDAWTNAIARGEARYNEEQAAANAIAQRNLERRMELEGQKILARTVRNISLGVVGSALLAFLTVALFLAFLAMEGHSKALRDAVEAIAGKPRDT